MKHIDEQFSIGNFEIDRAFNDIYSIDDPFMKSILKDTDKLVPPKDFDYDKLDEENQAAKEREEELKIQEIDAALELLTYIYQTKKDHLKLELRSLNSFKMKVDANLRDAEVEVYVKAVVNDVVHQKLEQEKSSKNPVVVQSPGRQEIRVYLHPVKSDPESIDFLVNLSPVADWSLGAFFPENANVTKSSHGITYWGMQDIDEKANLCNSSIKVQHYIALHRNKRGAIDGFEIYSFLFNEIVLKVFISLAQIKKIESVQGVRKKMSEDKTPFSEYYLHLTYPPRYYISILKPDIGCDEGFIRTWERVENFMFLRNDSIVNDEFFRLFLYGNTIVKVKIERSEEQRAKWEASEDLFTKIIGQFKGTIDMAYLESPWDLSKKLSSLNTIFKYKDFR